MTKDWFKQFFQNAETQQNVKEIIKPLGNLLYDQMYVYIWLICIYNVVLIFLVLVILILLVSGRGGGNGTTGLVISMVGNQGLNDLVEKTAGGLF